ncbi:MAG: flagellar M-ring protein FliF, partial [Acidobacteria bacterium]|nr:flagellar M-ring protein FliF [Acidobacteriota bacterium]
MPPPPAITQIAAFFKRLSPAQVLAMFLLAVSVGGFIFGLVYFMNRVEYVVLYANISPEDANAVVDRLKEQKVLYQLDDGGRTVRVPSDRVDEMRILMAGSGMSVGGGVGFEIFDKTSFGVTDFVQQVNYKRALEGELARTIAGLTEVSQARVHLVLPKETLFATEEGEGKASVVVKLKMGRALTQSAVTGIVNLIASSVDGLRPESVSVLDAYGRLLSKPSAGDVNEMLTEAQSRLKADVERQTSAKIVSILEPIVGEGRVRANVTAELDLDKVEETEEKFDPQSTVVRSQQKSSETSGTGGPGG